MPRLDRSNHANSFWAGPVLLPVSLQPPSRSIRSTSSGIQAEIEDFEVGPHVAGVGGAGQGYHAHVEGEPEDDLADGPAMTFGDAGQLGTGQHSAIGGQQREALIDQSVRGAELPNVTVPAPLGVAPVLDEAGPDSVPGGTGPEAARG